MKAFLPFAFALLLLPLIQYLILTRYSRVQHFFLGILATLVVQVGVIVAKIRAFEMYQGSSGYSSHRQDDQIVEFLSAVIFVSVTGAFLARLYRKWLDQDLTESERSSGTAVFRAWLSPANLCMAALVSVSGWLGFNVPLQTFLAATIGILCIWPLIHCINGSPVTPASRPVNDLSVEREKVLAMLEAGKITAEESAELLNALGTSVPSAPAAPQLTMPRFVFIGAALVFIGFLAPWFSYSPATELTHAAESIGLPSSISNGMKFPQMPFVVRVTGADIAGNLGWLVLACALSAAFLPMFSEIHRSTRRTLRLLAMGIGSIVLLFLATRDLSHVALGIVVVFAGYLVEWVAVWREENPAPSEIGIAAQRVL